MGERTKISTNLNSSPDRVKNLQPQNKKLEGNERIIKKAEQTTVRINNSPVAPKTTKQKYTEKVNNALDKVTGKPNIEIFGKTCDEIVESFENESQALKDYTLKANNFLVQVGQAKQNIKKYKDLEDTTILQDNEKSLVLVPQNHTQVVKDYRDIDLRIGGNGGKKEEKIQGPKIIAAYKNHLTNQKKLLADCPDKSSPIYQKLFTDYQIALQAYIECCGNFGDKNERASFRNIPEMTAMVQELLQNTRDTKEAFDWVKNMFGMLDEEADYLLGAEQKSALVQLSQVCAQELRHKMFIDQASIETLSDPEAKKNALADLIKLGTNIARLYTDRTFPMDRTLLDTDFAVQTLMDLLFTEQGKNIHEKHFEDTKPKYINKLDQATEGLLDAFEKKNGTRPKKSQLVAIQKELGLKNPLDKCESVEDFTMNYMIIRRLTTSLNNDESTTDQTIYQDEVLPFVDEQIHSALDKYPTVKKIENWLGVDYTTEQEEAFKLLSDIQGYGPWNLSDKTWQSVSYWTKTILAAVALTAIAVFLTPAVSAAIAASIGVAALSTVGNLAVAGGIGAVTNVATNALIDRKVSSMMSEGDLTQEGFNDLVQTHGIDAVVGFISGGAGELMTAKITSMLTNYIGIKNRMIIGGINLYKKTPWQAIVGGIAAGGLLDLVLSEGAPAILPNNSDQISEKQQAVLQVSLNDIDNSQMLGPKTNEYVNSLKKAIPLLKPEYFYYLYSLLQNIRNSYSKLHSIARTNDLVQKNKPLKQPIDITYSSLIIFEKNDEENWKKQLKIYSTLVTDLEDNFVLLSQKINFPVLDQTQNKTIARSSYYSPQIEIGPKY